MVHKRANTKPLLFLIPVALLLCITSFSSSRSPATHTVEISQMQFKPAELTVRKGDKIVFVNKDIMTHDVTEASGKSWRSPALAKGQTWSMQATQSTSYYCSYHPVMKGKITVTKSP